MKRLLAAVAIVALLGPSAHAEPRTWTSRDGKFTTQAELLDFKDGQVELRKADGAVIKVPLASLCDEDRELVRSLFPGAQEEAPRPGAEYREWASKAGTFTTTAEYLGYDGGKVHLRKLDGEEIFVPLTALSDADRDWIREELARQKEDEAAAAEAEAQEVTEQFGPQTVAMQLVKLEPPRGRSTRGNPAEYFLRMTDPQTFFLQVGQGPGDGEADFRRIVRAEPNYEGPVPFKGVVKLGGQDYAFALDAVGRQARGYNVLYFDANRNGDLTDDKPIAAVEVGAPAGAGASQSRFPPVDVEIDAGGTTTGYAVLLSALVRQTPVPYVSVSVYSGAIREGFIQQGREKIRLVLVDRNTNGRFDDTVAIRMVGDRVSTSEGDLLLVNPNTRNLLSADATMGRDRHFVSKTVCIGSHFYEMQVAPAGDQLTLTPKELEIGNVTNSSPAYRAVVYSDEYGVVLVSGVKDKKIPLPAGQWRVASYSIDASPFTGGSRTAVTATCGDAYRPITVPKDGTVELPFGAPFRAVVTPMRQAADRVYLSLAITGSADERVTSFYVNGSYPPEPRFVIKNSEGAVVHQGAFEYG
jgi:hypothetical protein